MATLQKQGHGMYLSVVLLYEMEAKTIKSIVRDRFMGGKLN